MIRAATLSLLLASVAAAAPALALAQAPEPLARTPDRPLLIEGVARATDGGLVVSSVHEARLFRLAPDGVLTPFGPEGRQALFGLAADPARQAIWAAEAPTPFDDQQDRPAALLRIDGRSGALVAEYSLSGEHAFGDVAVGPDGSVYVSDTTARQVLVVRPGAVRLQVVIQLPERGSPQGLAVSPDGRWLVFSDYRSGLHRIALPVGDAPLTPTAEAFAPLAAPEGLGLAGLDGLARDGDRIVAIQNGSSTQRVIRLSLTPDWSAIVAREVLSEDTALVEPTTGFVEDGALVFVSHSQWPDFGRDGQPTSAAPAGAVISRMALPAH